MSILDKHKVEYGDKPQVLVTVPGVVTFAGEFSDYSQGFALSGTSSKTLTLAVSKRNDSAVRVLSVPSNDKKKFSTTAIKYRKEDRWGNYIKGVIVELQKLAPVPGMNITLSGALLSGDGKILSAAIGIGVCLSFCKMTGFEMDHDLIARCCYMSSLRFCKELTNFHLIISILKAVEGKFMLFDMLKHSFEYVSDPFKDSNYSLLLADGHIPPVAMREELYARHNQAKEVMQEIARVADRGSLRDFPISDVSDRLMPISEETRKIGCYVFEESQIAKAMAKYFEGKNFPQIGKAFAKLGKGLRDCMEITCPELDWLAKRSMEVKGCLGNSIVYSGCGGFIAVVMEKNSIPAYAAKLEEYERIFGFKATVEDYNPSETVSVVVNPQ